MTIRKAVIPAAGLGTRFLPITKTMPKEMLPVVHKPVIQYVLEEAFRSGITDVLIVTGKGKRAIEDYFDRAEISVENEFLSDLEELMSALNIYYVRQKEQKGLGDAIRYAESFADEEPFAVLLGDTITTPPCIREMMDVHERYRSSVIAVERVPSEQVCQYGIIAGKEVSSGTYLIENLVEKPPVNEAPSDLAILGTYILTPAIFDCIRNTQPGRKGEIQLTDALQILLGSEAVYGQVYHGRRYDIGNKLDWLKANIELGLKDRELGESLTSFIREAGI